MGHFNKLTPAEAERLSILAEECAEVIQVIGKIQRHGFDSCHPNGGPNNRSLLEKELGDVSAAKYLMLESGDVDDDAIGQGFTDKIFSIPRYLHHNKHLFPDYRQTDNQDRERCCGDCDMPITECDCN
ncbi:MazG nucleotide pyrophosphohydrolase domain-containing protein [Neptuniibacter pectenicola]|uniref:MazG nucleotide pyrophosphohydrolase domain-containing protein n=1 Tax=Neptuniibacter pectenicola TaxID=1806669 RepID=UPI00082DF4D0|nr:MazG nucleotide pyrophosphohydrolase domain-containing protein [Neptuniibacter pectenicola]